MRNSTHLCEMNLLCIKLLLDLILRISYIYWIDNIWVHGCFTLLFDHFLLLHPSSTKKLINAIRLNQLRIQGNVLFNFFFKRGISMHWQDVWRWWSHEGGLEIYRNMCWGWGQRYFWHGVCWAFPINFEHILISFIKIHMKWINS